MHWKLSFNNTVVKSFAYNFNNPAAKKDCENGGVTFHSLQLTCYRITGSKFLLSLVSEVACCKKSLVNWLHVLAITCTRFWVNSHCIVAWMSRNSLLEAGANSEV